MRMFGRDKRSDSGQEASGRSSVVEEDLLALGRSGEPTLSTLNYDGVAAVFPAEVGTLSRQHSYLS